MMDPRGERIVGYITLHTHYFFLFPSYFAGWMGVGGIRTYRGAVVHSVSGSVRQAHIGDQRACQAIITARPS